MILHTVKWISKISWTKVLAVGVTYTIIATVIHQVESLLTLRYYMMPQYFGVWSKSMMPTAGPPPMEFYIKSTVLTFISGVSLALVYYYTRDMLPKSIRERIFLFADLLVGLQFIFFTMPSYLLFNLPFALLVSWFISSFIILLATAYLCVKVIK